MTVYGAAFDDRTDVRDDLASFEIDANAAPGIEGSSGRRFGGPWKPNARLPLTPNRSRTRPTRRSRLVPIDRTPPRHAVRAPVPQGTVVSRLQATTNAAEPALLRGLHYPGRCRVCRFSAPTWEVLSLTSSGFSSA